MSETNVIDNEEEMVTQMDLVAFLCYRYKIHFERAGSTVNTTDNKRVAYWVFKKNPKLKEALAEWNNPKHEGTRIIRAFREEQRTLRQMKAKLERTI